MIYTVLRVLLLAASLGVVVGVWLLFDETVNVMIAFLIALVVSGIGSYFLLNRYRETLRPGRRAEGAAGGGGLRAEEGKGRCRLTRAGKTTRTPTREPG